MGSIPLIGFMFHKEPEPEGFDEPEEKLDFDDLVRELSQMSKQAQKLFLYKLVQQLDNRLLCRTGEFVVRKLKDNGRDFIFRPVERTSRVQVGGGSGDDSVVESKLSSIVGYQISDYKEDSKFRGDAPTGKRES